MYIVDKLTNCSGGYQKGVASSEELNNPYDADLIITIDPHNNDHHVNQPPLQPFTGSDGGCDGDF